MPHLPLMYGYVILLGLTLFIVSLLLLIKAIKRKNRLHILLFSICIITITISVYYKLGSQSTLNQLREMDLKSYSELKNGDTTTIEGIVIDRNEKESVMSDSLRNIWLIEKYETATRKLINQHIVSIPQIVHDSIRVWLDYDHQMKESVSYRMKIKVTKSDDYSLKWRLIYIIKVDTLNQPPIIRR